ncbi:MAG: histidinol-phosphatase HisJ family protein, partial [Desulfobulbaceae bacterium]|nr:histidinol-phosphatase HisJ family protein [Desulfobulbaceae bacterium]
MKTDGHVHTRLCHHASGEMEDYVLAAIALKLERIIFLEHLEMGINYFESTWLTQDDFSYYFKEGRRLQEKYSGTLEIGLGVEVGFNPDRIRQLQSFLDRYHWDRVGISYHFLDVHGEHLNLL